MYQQAMGDMPSNTKMLSTGRMIEHAKQSPADTFIVATEVGILHRLRKDNPDKTFIAATESAVCPFMKMITLEKLYRTLKDDLFPIEVDKDIADRARQAIERMIAIG